MQQSYIDKIGGRKFVATMYVLVMTSILLYTKCIDANTFKDITLGISMVYVSGNVGQKFLGKNSNTTNTSS